MENLEEMPLEEKEQIDSGRENAIVPESGKDFSGNVLGKIRESLDSKLQKGKEFIESMRSSAKSPESEEIVEEAEGESLGYDLAISRQEKEAERKIAAVRGESHEIADEMPERGFVMHNLANSRENFMSEDERKENESMFDLGQIKEKAKDWQEYLAEKAGENDALILAEAHTSDLVEKKALLSFLEKAKESGVTDIGFELEEYYQEAFDKYKETGKFSENDNPEEYEKSLEYQDLLVKWEREGKEEDFEALEKISGGESENFLFKHCLLEHYPLIKESRRLGLNVKCLDYNHSYNTVTEDSVKERDKAKAEGSLEKYSEEIDEKRDQRMFDNVRNTLKKESSKMIILAGTRHVVKGGFNHKNLADLLAEEKSIKSCSVVLDRDLDGDSDYMEDKKKEGFEDMNLNSAMYTALEKENIKNVGFDLDKSILKSDKASGRDFPFNGYVKIDAEQKY